MDTRNKSGYDDKRGGYDGGESAKPRKPVVNLYWPQAKGPDRAMTSNGKMELRFDGSVAILAFNDPAVLNAIGRRMREDFSAALDRIEASGARCILLTGNGRAFCSGANLNDPDRPPRDREAEARGEQESDLEGWYNPTLERLRASPVPVVSAVNGAAAGIGMSFALSADIRIAARSGYFLQAFARIGLVPDGGATWILPRLVGMARAMELSMLAERLPAETALEWGMVNRVVDDGALMDEAMAMARRLAGGPAALGLIRRLYWQGLEQGYSAQLKAEADAQTAAARTRDYEEGVAAFREKRPAAFSGR